MCIYNCNYIYMLDIKMFRLIRLIKSLLSPQSKSGQETGDVLYQTGLSHKQERSSQNRLNNLARDTLVKTCNTLMFNNLTESIHDRIITFLSVVGLLQLHTRFDNTTYKPKENKIVISIQKNK
jgi:hypothetical protein